VRLVLFYMYYYILHLETFSSSNRSLSNRQVSSFIRISCQQFQISEFQNFRAHQFLQPLFEQPAGFVFHSHLLGERDRESVCVCVRAKKFKFQKFQNFRSLNFTFQEFHNFRSFSNRQVTSRSHLLPAISDSTNFRN
jgi:hypothetical protein